MRLETPSDSVAARDGLLTRKQAAEYLNVSIRWLEETALVPRVDLSRPGARRATIRYRRSDLDAFVESRVSGGGA